MLKAYVKKCVKKLKSNLKKRGKYFVENCMVARIMGQTADCSGLSINDIENTKCMKDVRSWFGRAKTDYNKSKKSAVAIKKKVAIVKKAAISVAKKAVRVRTVKRHVIKTKKNRHRKV